MQTEKLNPDHSLFSETKISQYFFTLMKLSNDTKDDGSKHQENDVIENHDKEEEEGEERGGGAAEEEGEVVEKEEEFSFMCEGANTAPIVAEEAFINGQIKPVFPLFNRDLLLSSDDSSGLLENLPMRPPVKNVFVETSEDNTPVTSSTPKIESAAGPYCEWSNRKAVEASPEVCKKSNSTGFSKIWRFKDLLGRSNSDGRDAFVFLNNSHAPHSTMKQPSSVKGEEKCERKEPTVKVNRTVKKSSKSKTASLSAHEVYLKSKAKEEERRRSYLPYRPELMGFFTNVNGGLSKNVHPF